MWLSSQTGMRYWRIGYLTEIGQKTTKLANVQTPGLPIGVRTADCVPVILYAEDIKAVAAVHAGWKGTLGGIVDVVVDRLADMGSDPRNIHATFGISICGNCYEVDNDLGERSVCHIRAEKRVNHVWIFRGRTPCG